MDLINWNRGPFGEHSCVLVCVCFLGIHAYREFKGNQKGKTGSVGVQTDVRHQLNEACLAGLVPEGFNNQPAFSNSFSGRTEVMSETCLNTGVAQNYVFQSQSNILSFRGPEWPGANICKRHHPFHFYAWWKEGMSFCDGTTPKEHNPFFFLIFLGPILTQAQEE